MNYFHKNHVELAVFDAACTRNGLTFRSFDGMHCRIIGGRTVDVWIGSLNKAWRDQSRGHTKSTPYSINKVLNLALCPLPSNVADKMDNHDRQQKAKIMPDFARTPKATNQVNLESAAAPWATGGLVTESRASVVIETPDSKDVTIAALRRKVAEQVSVLNQYAIINEQLRGQYAEQQAEIKKLEDNNSRALHLNSQHTIRANKAEAENATLRNRVARLQAKLDSIRVAFKGE